jgi:hypothetical protein
MPAALLAVLLPALYWDQPIGTADQLRKAAMTRLYVAAGHDEAWRNQGFDVTPFDRRAAGQAVTPTVQYHIDVASATRVPWVTANGWRFAREPDRPWFYDAASGSAALAAAEAFTYGVQAAVHAPAEDLNTLARMLSFLASIDNPRLPVMADIGVIDDGSNAMGEVLNLMVRHILLFQLIKAPDPKFDLIIRLGSAEYTTADAANPYEFAMKVRRRLTDEKRLLRLFGSNVVLALLTGDGAHARVHLLNYGPNPVRGLRVRVLKPFKTGKLAAFEHAGAALEDYAVEDGATEFTIPEIGPYAVVDLSDREPLE